MKLAYPVCFYPCKEINGYTVVIPDLQGCVSQGKNFINAYEMAVDCATGWILDEIKDRNPIPKASNIEDIVADEYENGFVSMILLNIDSFLINSITR